MLDNFFIGFCFDFLSPFLCAGSPHTDDTVSVASEKSGTIGRGPGEGSASGVGRLGLEVGVVLVEVRNNVLGFEIPNDDTRVCTSAEPVAVGGKDEGVDDVTSVEGVEVLAFVKVPEHGNTVLSTRGAKGTVGRNSDGVDVTRVSSEVAEELELVGDGPNFHQLVPASGDNDGILGLGGKLDTANPVAMGVLDSALALTESIPETNGAIATTRNDLTVVGGEGNRENIFGVSDEATCGGAIIESPETKSGIPRGGKSELAVLGNDNILNEVVVSTESLLGATVLLRILKVTLEVEHHDLLVARGGEDHVRALGSSGDGGNPIRVSLENAAKRNLFSLQVRARHDTGESTIVSLPLVKKVKSPCHDLANVGRRNEKKWV